MNERSISELKKYLRQTTPSSDPQFDAFLQQVDIIFKLRLAAEHFFKSAPHVAINKQKALPLCWKTIEQILHPGQESPPENLITQIARNCFNETEDIIRNMRKVLFRDREKVALGLVQQVDPHCLRWLSKQPGRNAIEKAGAKQQILAIVRKENFNTLENRVFKDFLIRCQREAALYVQNFESTFRDHATIRLVKRLGRLCVQGLRDPVLDGVGSMYELSTPNYVLRQERRYAKIWKAYCELIRQADIAERLWLRREELAATLEKLRCEVLKHTAPRAKYHCPIWFNFLDGKRELLDKQFFENELLGENKKTDFPIHPASDNTYRQDDVIVDLTGQQPEYDLLIYGCHENAKPYLQNYSRPSIEDINGQDFYFLRDLISKTDVNDQDLRHRLRDYFEQLYGKFGGKRWFVIVSDDRNAFWLERIIKSIPLARSNVFLLWRSVATAIGVMDQLNCPKRNDTIAIIDVQQGGVVGMSKIALVRGQSGEMLIPQRKSYIRHPKNYDRILLQQNGTVPEKESFLYGRTVLYRMTKSNIERISTFAGKAAHVVLIDNIGVSVPDHTKLGEWLVADGALLEEGMKSFIKQRDAGKIPYYDELEALSLIVQTEDEQLLAKTLVPADKRSPGGREIVTDTIKRAAVLKQHSDYVDLLLCMGEALPDAHLKQKRHEFHKNLVDDHAIDLSVKVTPGQGMALVTVMSDFLHEPIELDFLRGMKDKNEKGEPMTMTSLEDEMERSFPPDSPDVESDSNLWGDIRYEVMDYLSDRIMPDGKWFAKATKKYPDGVPLPKGASPLERLRRKNVFGNKQGQQYPQGLDHKALFAKLSNDCLKCSGSKRKEIIRLIAWTYASKESFFDPIRKKTIRHIFDYAKENTLEAPLFQEMTLCANLCILPEEWSRCLKAIELRITDYNNRVTRDFYLLYNLLQFHPTLILDTEYYLNNRCWKIAHHIPYWYDVSRDNGITIGYILKSILYLLRCRRFDGKKFLTKAHDPDHYEIFDKCLNSPVHHSHERLRLLTKEYLYNKGTIDGLPVD
ncbi:MAG: DUF2357 domain-containing protein [Deltaproteobacteria bacterium]|nr:DUF2357 domain-containing protein [Deltaproteobacteria bacterium]MBW2661691.1 DUF2357 domain-containing protein [Deltaproteobacteria bacterium]